MLILATIILVAQLRALYTTTFVIKTGAMDK